MLDDTSPKLEIKGASEDLTKETNILARGFQMNATLGKITEIGLGKITEIVFFTVNFAHATQNDFMYLC